MRNFIDGVKWLMIPATLATVYLLFVNTQWGIPVAMLVFGFDAAVIHTLIDDKKSL